MRFTRAARNHAAAETELLERFWAGQGAAARAERVALYVDFRGRRCPSCYRGVRLTGTGRVARHEGCDYSDRVPLPLPRSPVSADTGARA